MKIYWLYSKFKSPNHIIIRRTSSKYLFWRSGEGFSFNLNHCFASFCLNQCQDSKRTCITILLLLIPFVSLLFRWRHHLGWLKLSFHKTKSYNVACRYNNHLPTSDDPKTQRQEGKRTASCLDTDKYFRFIAIYYS